MANNSEEEGQERGVVMLQRFRNTASRGRGASATELIILLVLISLVCIGVIKLFGGTIKAKLTGAQAGVSTLGTDPVPSSSEFGAASSDSAAGGKRGQTSGASGSAATGGASSQGGGGSTESRPVTAPSSAVAEAEARPGSVGGFNPFILVIFLGLAGLLVYVFFAKKSG